MSQLVVVKYSRRVKRVSLQRFLVSKIVYEVTKITQQDLFVLYDNQIWLEQRCLRDFDFSRKFGDSLEELSKNLKLINLSSGVTVKALIRLSTRIKKDLEEFLVPHRNYSDYKKRFSGLFQLRTLSPPQETNKRLPPKRIIGTGYRDKGTARNLAKDGSPRWQEVASRDGQIKMALNKIKNAKKFKEIEDAFKIIFSEEDWEKYHSASGYTGPSKETQRR